MPPIEWGLLDRRCHCSVYFVLTETILLCNLLSQREKTVFIGLKRDTTRKIKLIEMIFFFNSDRVKSNRFCMIISWKLIARLADNGHKKAIHHASHNRVSVFVQSVIFCIYLRLIILIVHRNLLLRQINSLVQITHSFLKNVLQS